MIFFAHIWLLWVIKDNHRKSTQALEWVYMGDSIGVEPTRASYIFEGHGFATGTFVPRLKDKNFAQIVHPNIDNTLYRAFAN